MTPEQSQALDELAAARAAHEAEPDEPATARLRAATEVAEAIQSEALAALLAAKEAFAADPSEENLAARTAAMEHIREIRAAYRADRPSHAVVVTEEG